MPPVSQGQHVLGCQSSVRGDVAHREPPTDDRQPTGKAYWRSVEDLADTPEFREFVHREFPSVGDLIDSSERRTFLKIMGASLALAGAGGLGGCRRWPATKLAPYAHRPADRAEGIPVHYATNMEFAGIGAGLLAVSYDGRPIKLEGNPEHPVSRGSSTAVMQAAILDLYDQDRSRAPAKAGVASTWDEFARFARGHFDGLKNARGNGLAVLCEATSSPSVLALKQRFMARFPSATWHEYEAINNDNEVAGSAMAFGGGGTAYRPMYAFDQARTVVCLDADVLGMTSPGAVKWIRDFASARRCDEGAEPCRLYAFEGIVSLTGVNADHRVTVRSSDVARIAAWIASQVGVTGVPASLAATDVTSLMDKAAVTKVLEHLVADLKGRGPSIVIAGERQPAEVHLLAHLINRQLGNVGKAVTYAKIDGVESQVGSLASLVEKINAGSVQTLVMLGGNPVYTAPADLDFAGALKKVGASIHLSDYVDETSLACTWHVNRAHFLEAWGDVRAYDGTYGVVQPLIMPFFNGKTPAELLAFLCDDAIKDSYGITRGVFAAMTGGEDEARWRKALHDGFVATSAFAAGEAPVVVGSDIASAMAALEQKAAAATGAIEVVFMPDPALYDGRLANNGWLQELPDPITKLTWDNAVLLSPTAAKAINVKTGDMVEVTCSGRKVTAAAMIIPGQHDAVATLPLGCGRTFESHVAKDAGFNFYRLRQSDGMGYASATITKAPGSYVLATTQDHHAIDSWPGGTGTQERLPTLFREASLNEFKEDPTFVKHRTHVVTRLSLFPEEHAFQSETIEGGRYRGEYAWGMSIDLNACTGCNACVIACQAENNIAVVGKDQIKRGREMHWIRIDRYFKGTSEANPSGFMLAPVTCVHCENAPCEQVCPVAATTHDDSGLNVMVYNRCIGTRYCSNNCPYKVRRFNYFDYWGRGPLREQPHLLLQVEPEYYTLGQAKADPLRQMQMNPEVTVRMRGIMEKCTYCTQRIAKARIAAKNEWVRAKSLNPDDPKVRDARVPIADGSFTTACAQACPAKAIVFGDLNDANSQVKKMHRNPRAYEMLEEINTKPRTRHLARIRNPAFEEPGHDGHGSHSPQAPAHGAPAATSGGHG